MNLLDRIASFFRPEQPSKLRNKPGGMAWIVGIPTGTGCEVLNGRAVKTERFDGEFWWLSPPQKWMAARDCCCYETGMKAAAGDSIHTFALADDNLQPWKDLGSDAQDESLWASPPRESHSKPRVGA